jgi:hypothetical protein
MADQRQQYFHDSFPIIIPFFPAVSNFIRQLFYIIIYKETTVFIVYTFILKRYPACLGKVGGSTQVHVRVEVIQ